MKRSLRVFFDAGILALAAALVAVVLWPGVETAGLAESVTAAVPESGVKHPVTAVLLNFRGYDTLLEMLVLLLALIGVRSLGALPPVAMPEAASPVLAELLRFLTPLLLLVAVYLLWRGSSGPGGAFQAGAVLGAAGVLWLLVERPGGRVPPRLPLRPLLALGVAAFAGAGTTFALTQGAFLQYPVASAYTIIFAIEALATVSIAGTLVVLFIGAPIDEQ